MKHWLASILALTLALPVAAGEIRLDLPAMVAGELASRAEQTTTGPVVLTGHNAGDRVQPSLAAGLSRQSTQQRGGVGMRPSLGESIDDPGHVPHPDQPKRPFALGPTSSSPGSASSGAGSAPRTHLLAGDHDVTDNITLGIGMASNILNCQVASADCPPYTDGYDPIEDVYFEEFNVQ